MLLDDVFEANKEAMREEVKESKDVDIKYYLKNINIDNIGESTKKAVKTDFGYTVALSVAGGIGMSIYFHSLYPMVFGLIGGLTSYSVLTLAEKAKLIKFK